jgi:hypothetical protein
MIKFIYKISISALIISLILISVNFFGDAAKLFDSDYEKRMANIIFAGDNVTNISNYDERKFQKELISKLEYTPDILILGSSRTMLINNKYFPDQLIFNSSVSGASIEDFISIYHLYKIEGVLPKKIIIGIDPWLFNINNNQVRWKSLLNEYNQFHNKDLVASPSYFKYKQLLSPSYFQSSIKNIGKNTEPYGTSVDYNVTNTKLTDGSLTYSKTFREATSSEIEVKVSGYIQGNIYSIENFNELSPKIIGDFKKLIKDIKGNSQIEFFLAPYHPTVYEVVKNDYPMVLKTENFINDFAKQNSIQVLGSFNPNIISINEDYFYDGMHLKEKGIMRILN